MKVVKLTTEEANAELARLLRALPYSRDELENFAENYELRPAEQRAFDRIKTLEWLLTGK